MKWAVIGQIGNRILSLASSIVLARLLAPTDFGLAAMVATVTSLAGIFANFGMSSALVQRKELTAKHTDAAFVMNIVAGALASIAVVVTTPLASRLFNEPRLNVLIPIASLSFVIVAPTVVHAALLRREMTFSRLAAIEIIGTGAGGIAGIGGALLGWGVWSIVGMQLATVATSTIARWFLYPIRLSFRYDQAAARDLLGFSVDVLGTNILGYATRNLHNILVGRSLGAGLLGLYSRAYGGVLVPLNQLMQPVALVMFPALSTLQGDTERLGRAYLRVTKQIALLLAPMLAVVWVLSDVLIPTVFGVQWAESVPILRILCVGAYFQAAMASSSWLMLGSGNSALNLRWTAIHAAVTLTAMLVGLRFGVTGVAWAYSAANFIVWAPWTRTAGKLAGLSARTQVGNIVTPGLCAILVLGATLVSKYYWPISLPQSLQIPILGGLGFSTLVIAARLIPESGFADTMAMIQRTVARKPL